MTKLLNIGLLVLGAQSINLEAYEPDHTEKRESIPEYPVNPDCRTTNCDKKKNTPGSSGLVQIGDKFIDDYDFDTQEFTNEKETS